MSELINEQNPPQPSEGDMWLEVIKEMQDRREMGIAKYGQPVQPFNGRKPLVDAFQEVLDLAVYLRQEIAEREKLQAEIDRLKAGLFAEDSR